MVLFDTLKKKNALSNRANAKPDLVSGFTLIELLVVIAIIALLSSVVLASLNDARRKSRNATKQAQLQEIMKGIQLYYDTTGQFPANRTPSCNCWCTIGVTSHNGGLCLQEIVDSGVLSTYPFSPDAQPYYYYNYGSYAMVASRMNPQEYGPGPNGWHCSGYDADKIWCLNFFR